MVFNPPTTLQVGDVRPTLQIKKPDHREVSNLLNFIHTVAELEFSIWFALKDVSGTKLT